MTPLEKFLHKEPGGGPIYQGNLSLVAQPTPTRWPAAPSDHLGFAEAYALSAVRAVRTTKPSKKIALTAVFSAA
jgi:hypothetical protein